MNPFARFPFFRYTLPLVAGISFEVYFYISSLICFSVLLFFVCVVAVYAYSKTLRLKYNWRYYFGTTIFLVWFSLGMTLISWNNDSDNQNYFENIQDKKYLIVKLKEPLSKKRKSFKALGEVKGVYDGSKITTTKGNLLLYFLNDSAVSSSCYCGDEILVKCREQSIEGPKNPGEFNFGHFLAYKNIYHQIFLKPGDWKFIKEANEYEILRMVFRTRDLLLGILNKYIDDKTERGVAGALLFGYTDDLDNDVVDAYARTGTLHVLAVSGMHVAILYLVVSFLFKPFQKKIIGAWLVAFFTIFLIWFYSLISGMSPSIIRASVMFTIIIAGKVLRDDISIYNNLFTSSCFILCYNPYSLFDAGFQLSYLAVIGIVYFQPKISPLLIFKSWLGRQTWGLITVSMAAQLTTFPISLYYFSQFPNYFIISNLIIIPITTFIMYCGILLIVICKITPVAMLLGYGINKLIALADYLIISIQSLPYAVTERLYITKIETVAWYLFIFLVSAFFATSHKNYLRIGIILFCLLIMGQGIDKYKQQRQYTAVINAVSGSFSLNIIEGKKNSLFCDSEVSNSNQKIKMHFKGFWNCCGVPGADIQNMNWHYVSNAFVFNGKYLITSENTACFVDENFSPYNAPKVKINYLVLKKKCKMQLELLNNFFEYDILVLDGSLKPRTRKKYIEEANQLHIKCRDILNEGALVFH